MSSEAHFNAIVAKASEIMDVRDQANSDLKLLFSFAKEVGFDPKALRAAINMSRADEDEVKRQKRIEFEDNLIIYRGELGVTGPLDAIGSGAKLLNEPDDARTQEAVRRLSKRTAAARRQLALAHLSKEAEQ